jgi:hypothetical protein
LSRPGTEGRAVGGAAGRAVISCEGL